MSGKIGRILLVLALIISLIARNPLLFLMDVLLMVVFGSSWLWGRYCLSNVSYARRFGALRLFCGEETDLWIEVVNAKPLPLAWLKAEDEFPRGLPVQNMRLDYSAKAERETLVNVFTLRWYERVRRHYRLRAARRGAYDFGPALVSSGDLFGFRERRMEALQLDSVLVYPKIVSIDKLGLQAARPLGDFRAGRRIVEDPLRFAAVRDYQPGDSVRHIHWKATARRGTLQMKVFDPSASQQLMVCLNTQTLDNAYAGVMTEVFETTIVVAASIVHAALKDHRPTGVFANAGLRDSHRWLRVPASRRSDQLTRILESLAGLTYLTMIPLENLLRLEAPQFPYGATIIVVSPIVNDEIVSALLDLRAAGHPIALIVIGALPPTLPPDVPIYSVTENWTNLERLEL